MKPKVKPPVESKVTLMAQISDLLEEKFRDPRAAIEYLTNFFSSADLLEIRKELEQWKK